MMPHSGLSNVNMGMYECRQRDKAVQDIENYVKGGFLALQYGSINYLPCYAAAGLLVKLGLFNTHGEVWSSSVSMLLPYSSNTHESNVSVSTFVHRWR